MVGSACGTIRFVMFYFMLLLTIVLYMTLAFIISRVNNISYKYVFYNIHTSLNMEKTDEQ